MVVFLKILLRLESVIIISLFVIFFFLFGLPAYRKYRMEDVIIKEIKKLEKPVESPAVTVCLDFVSFKLVDWNSNFCRFIDNWQTDGQKIIYFDTTADRLTEP